MNVLDPPQLYSLPKAPKQASTSIPRLNHLYFLSKTTEPFIETGRLSPMAWNELTYLTKGMGSEGLVYWEDDGGSTSSGGGYNLWRRSSNGAASGVDFCVGSLGR